MADHGDILDVVGVGFGPANMALAAALEEEERAPGGRSLKRLFFESKKDHIWHEGMLIEGSTVQISFLKDLVTMRNPQSPFSFLSYLWARDRLHQFINLREFFPTRIEFNDYYRWVAAQLAGVVHYGKWVESVSPVTRPGSKEVELLRVAVRDAQTRELAEYTTSTLVIATGALPSVPAGVEARSRRWAFHSHEFALRMRSSYPDRERAYRFVVVGSGQSAAEIFYHLMSTYPNASITAALRRFAYKPLDDSDFINEIFFPESVDLLYGLPYEKRQALLDMHPDINNSAVDSSLIRRIYKIMYEERVAGQERLKMLPLVELRSVEEDEEAGLARGRFLDLMKEEEITLEADALILATGYERQKKPGLLAEVDPYLEVSEADGYRVSRSYQIVSREGFHPKIFLQGFCEDSHGVSDTLLSLLPIRALEISTSILASDLSRRELVGSPS